MQQFTKGFHLELLVFSFFCSQLCLSVLCVPHKSAFLSHVCMFLSCLGIVFLYQPVSIFRRRSFRRDNSCMVLEKQQFPGKRPPDKIKIKIGIIFHMQLIGNHYPQAMSQQPKVQCYPQFFCMYSQLGQITKIDY